MAAPSGDPDWMTKPSSISVRRMSYPPRTSGPVPIDVQKQVLEQVVHWTATMKAADRRARKSSSVNWLPRNTRSWTARAAISQARTPRNATGGTSGTGCSKPILVVL